MVASATTTGAPFSFHCVICVEAFNAHDRPPVVLPCGHTYICEPCSKRIDKCTECRMSLFIEQSSSFSGDLVASASNDYGKSASMEYGYECGNGCSSYDSEFDPHIHEYPLTTQASSGSSTTSTPLSRQQIRQIRLLAERYGSPKRKPRRQARPARVRATLPRNIVLLELMDAAVEQHQYSTSNHGPHNEHGGASMVLMDDGNTIESIVGEREADNEQVVLNSIEVLASSCGTYVVREQNGLTVYSVSTMCVQGPDVGDEMNIYSSKKNRRAEGRMGECGLKLGKRRGRIRKKCSNMNNLIPSPQTTVLKHGQKVQIVNGKDGVYKLARNQGVIFADSTQLVKVGIAQETSCKVEGMIYAIQSTKSELVRQMDSVNCNETNLRSNLNLLLSQPEDYPVVSELPTGENEDKDSQTNKNYYVYNHVPNDEEVTKSEKQKTGTKLKKKISRIFSSFRSRSGSSIVSASKIKPVHAQ